MNHGLPARYRVGDLLGMGATAQVRRAHDTVLDAPRAVKILKEGSTNALGARLLREARALARVRHPHILRVYDAGVTEDGRAWVLMDIAEGGSLAARLAKDGPYPLEDGLRLGVQVLSGLAAAHEVGIVHRDVKPANVLLDRRGDVLLADFGIAAVDDGRSYTDVGSTLGTFAYMAPEQRLDASAVGPAADLYAAAATLYQALTGASPIDLFAAGPDHPRWSGVPIALRDVLRRALAYEPEDRYPSAASFADALRALQGRDLHAHAMPPPVEPLPPSPTVPMGTNLTAALDHVYRQSLHDRMAELLAVRQDSVGCAPEAMDRVRRIAHALRGTGATYGFPLITERAGALEDALQGTDCPPAALLDALIDTMREVLANDGGQRSRVLVAIADPVASSALQIALQRADRTVIATDTVASARQALHDGPVVAAVIDAVLPDEDGRALLLEPGLSDVPTVVVASRASDALRSELAALGADAVLDKPIDPTRVASTLSSLLTKVGTEAATVDTATGLPDGSAFRDALVLTQGVSQPGTAFTVAHVLPPLGAEPALWGTVLRSTLADDILVARLGERDFACLFHTDEETAAAAMARALDAADAIAPSGHSGCAGLVSGGGGSVADLLVSAARMARHARDNGRGVAIADRRVPVSAHVLLAEDDAATAALVVRLLAEEGLRVTHAQTGDLALDRIHRGEADLILLDVHLPAVDGFALLEAARDTGDVPVVMLTAVGDERQVAKAFELGADDYIVKPFRPMELKARVRRLLRRPRRG